MLAMSALCLALRPLLSRSGVDGPAFTSIFQGATRWQTVWGITLPAAVPGIMTGSIPAMSRAIGESEHALDEAKGLAQVGQLLFKADGVKLQGMALGAFHLQLLQAAARAALECECWAAKV